MLPLLKIRSRDQGKKMKKRGDVKCEAGVTMNIKSG